ncbi:hypothetical protein CAEBREN_01001 [Caenorhabditis brenneri]|uniref:RING-type domain-containing protein n=1 Tax=Caenorhabditis brenneri TaxID=135651 RepID=G0NYJ7_CAEBE|nr:hypothetical protein CAEBREN_01001 [Caenorhabditis brenneri]
MPRKRPAPPEPVSNTRSRTSRRSAPTTAPASKRKRSPESEPESDEDYDVTPPTSTTKKSNKRGQVASNRGRGGSKTKRGSFRVKQEVVEDEEENEDEEDEEVSSREETLAEVSKSKKQTKPVMKKKKKRETPPDSPPTSSASSRSPSPEPSVTKTESVTSVPRRGRKSAGTPATVGTRGKKKETVTVSTPVKKKNVPPKRTKQPVEEDEEEEEESAEEKKLRERAERKARRVEAAKNRPKLTLEQKLEKLKKKKERRARRKEREKEEIMRQKYGSRKIKAEASKWNFGPISSINQRRREEMMAYFPRANFTSDNGVPNVMTNFRRATVKYNMEVLNPFITCSICDGYIVDATTIIDCMHTFCKSCLLSYFDNDNRTCPTCGTFIHGSHPTHYVTYDRAVNELVNQFVPKLEKKEMESRKQFLRDCREAIGIDTAAEDRERQERLERERITGTNRCYPLEKPRFSHHRDDCQVVVNLLPGTANLPLVTRPFVRCSEMTTMNTLRKFLALQIWDDQSRYSDLDMFCDGQLMGKDFSVRFVWMMKRRGQPKAEPLIIRYHKTRT